MNQTRSIRKLLEKKRITASTPCRIDVGGTWDLKALALPYDYLRPCTVNFALDMRTRVALRPYEDGSIRVFDDYAYASYLLESIDFECHFGLVFAIASHFGVHGVEIGISYDAPRMSGLGGSGSLAVAVVAALETVTQLIPPYPRAWSKVRVVQTAHDIEDGLRFSYTGLQDQCAAAYGGIHQWYWSYTSETKFGGIRNSPPGFYQECATHMVLACTGESHNSYDLNLQQIASFYNPETRHNWFRINEITTEFDDALSRYDWRKAALLVQEENDIRLSMVPDRITPIGEELQAIAHKAGAGFAVVGAGNGGCVWALCPTVEQAEQVKERWETLLQTTESGRLLDCNIDSEGLIINVEDIND